jgi:hypothetical protein
VLFDPRAAPGTPPPDGRADYLAPRDGAYASLQSAVSNVRAVVESVGAAVDAVVPAALSRAASAVGAAAVSTAVRALGTIAPEAADAVASAVGAPAGTPAEGGGLLPAERALLEALAPPKARGTLPSRKWGKQPSRDEQCALLAAAASAAAAGAHELALRGYLRAFEVSRATPLLLSAANMHLRLGELDHADAFCSALRELEGGLSAEQRAVLGRKEQEISAARRQRAPPGLRKGVSAWQVGLDQAQLEKLRP